MRRTSSMIGRWGLRPAVSGSGCVRGGWPSSALLHWPTSVLAVSRLALAADRGEKRRGIPGYKFLPESSPQTQRS